MKILITSPDTFTPITGLPEVGRYYNLEDAATGTVAQLRAFHALVSEYFNSGLYSDKADTKQELKEKIKLRLGAGFCEYVYAVVENGKPKIYRVKTRQEIPDFVNKDEDYRQMIRGRLKSLSDYTKKERSNIIENLKTEMLTVGVQSKKFFEILKGMEE